VGDIADEFDALEPPLGTLAPSEAGAAHGAADTAVDVTVPNGERSWLVEGVLREDELEEVTGFRLPEGPYETLAGFLMARLGHIPVAGEIVEENGWEFTVVEVERRRIEQVRVVAREASHG
jgi:CBS domain containing-hemolysin-like protein